ncbi:MAG: TonB-dependent receptor plug domain-containing protein [Telmatospirillum sp.]|nr:TonB-dependent receptor plug domain-containing protein [Telmatospirillum sp.]
MKTTRFRQSLMATVFTGWAFSASVTGACAADTPTGSASSTAPDEIVVTAGHTRSELNLSGDVIQRELPGMNAVKAVELLPGVIFETADPWGNNEQNSALYIHGFNTQQLGYTMDGVPLGDQSYGNYNGLSPQRALISENIKSVGLSSGAGDLGTASTSNLGGTLAVFSTDPKDRMGADIAQTFGSYSAFRTYARGDTGTFGDNNSAYVSFVRQSARAWDFDGEQGGYQVNGKFVHRGEKGTLKVFFDWSDKTEPNEDAVSVTRGQKNTPYTRPYLYPDIDAARAYLNSKGMPPAALGANYANYFSDAQRSDYLTYVSYDYAINDNATWKNLGYYHHDDGRGVVAFPYGQYTSVFNPYYPGQNLKDILGGTGYGIRTTEYRIDREGEESTLDYRLGNHDLQFGAWFEHNSTTTSRRWYAMSPDATPYDTPTDPLFTQVQSLITNNVLQTHVQDAWHVIPTVTLQAGFKSSLQYANGLMPVQPRAGSYSGASGALPTGEIDTREPFLPQAGILWDVTPHDQLFVNVQKNLRQYMTYGLGGASPWSLGSQTAFNLFKAYGHPESSWTYDLGWRYDHRLDLGPLSGIGGQIDLYHVDFSNRQLLISPNPTLTTFVGGVAILENVGSVTTNGVDMAMTMRFGPHFSFYNGLSYNRSTYDNNYVNGTTVVGTAGKIVPGDPTWMDKFYFDTNYENFDLRLIGEYIGRRYATYTNDMSVGAYRQYNLQMSYTIDDSVIRGVKDLQLSFNITNLTNTRAVSTVSVGAASNTYAAYPLAPREYFFTVKSSF